MKHEIRTADKLWIRGFTFAAFTLVILLVPAMAYAQKSSGNDTQQFTPNGKQLVVTIKDGPAAGMLPGQAIRFNFFNPAPVGTPAGGARVRVFDGSGGIVTQTSGVQIPAGSFHSFEIPRESLNMPGDPNTGRIQFRVEIELTVWQEGNTRDIPSPVQFPSSYELVDRESGRTILIVLLLPAVQSARDR